MVYGAPRPLYATLSGRHRNQVAIGAAAGLMAAIIILLPELARLDEDTLAGAKPVVRVLTALWIGPALRQRKCVRRTG